MDPDARPAAGGKDRRARIEEDLQDSFFQGGRVLSPRRRSNQESYIPVLLLTLQNAGGNPKVSEPAIRTGTDKHLLHPYVFHLVGIDPSRDPADAYVFDDDQLPLLVFGALSLVTAGVEIEVGGTRVRVPRVAGLLLEKLVTDRTGDKGERDLLVALGLLMTAGPGDFEELDAAYGRMRPELRHAVRSNLTVLSLLEARPGMPDPRPRRAAVAAALRRLERLEGGAA